MRPGIEPTFSAFPAMVGRFFTTVPCGRPHNIDIPIIYLFYSPLPAAMKLKDGRQYIKKQRHHFADKSPYSQRYGFSSNHVWM